MTTGETIASARWTVVGKVMSLLFNMLSRLVIAFLEFFFHSFSCVQEGHKLFLSLVDSNVSVLTS